MNPLSRETLEETLRVFGSDPSISERLAWWLGHGQSCERWFQFEWAYRLARHLTSRFFVACEHKRIDVAIFPSTPQSAPWSNKPYAGIEIKWLGNWYVDTFAGIRKDVDKVDRFDFPAMALAVWLSAGPKPSSSAYSWLMSQVEKGIGKAEFSQIRPSVVAAVGREPEVEATASCFSHRDFETLELHAIGFQNALARGETK